MLAYTRQGAQSTLREGLLEYYRAHPWLDLSHSFLGQRKCIVFSHDVCHVIFGCGASSADELIVETWTVLGTRISAGQYVDMIRSGLFQEIYRTFGPRRLAKRLVLTLPRVARAFMSTQRVRRRWRHFGYATEIDQRLCDIRRRHGIVVV